MTEMSPVAVVFLSEPEAKAILIHLVGHEDPAVQDAVTEAARKVLERTRGSST
jgi:hypothetical protein